MNDGTTTWLEVLAIVSNPRPGGALHRELAGNDWLWDLPYTNLLVTLHDDLMTFMHLVGNHSGISESKMPKPTRRPGSEDPGKDTDVIGGAAVPLDELETILQTWG